MPEKAWKRLERYVGAFFGCRRIPVGEDNQRRVGQGDLDLQNFYASVRLRKAGSIESWYQEAAKKARKAGLRPVLFSRRPHRPGVLVVVDLGDLHRLAQRIALDRRTAWGVSLRDSNESKKSNSN